MTSSQIKDMVSRKFGTNKNSVLPSDYCYNRTNKGISFSKHIFEMIDRDNYRYLGENYPYSGHVYHRPMRAAGDSIVGEWKNGRIIYMKDMHK